VIRPSMSKLGLLSACQFWARDGVAWVNQQSAAATFGTTLHAFAEAYIDAGCVNTAVMPPLSDDERSAWDRLRTWLDANRRTGWRTEVPFAYHVQQGTARELPKSHHRDYSAAGPAEICGTADLVYMSRDDAGPFACCDDFKWSGFHGDAQKAQAQLGGLALCVARAWGVDRVRARAIRIGPSGPVDDTSEVYWLDSFDLAAMEAEIRADLARVATAEPAPGPHCTERWCPALAACPATQSAIVQVIPDAALVRKDWRYQPAIESPDHAAWLLTVRPVIRKAMDQVDASLKRLVADGPVRTSDGRPISEGQRNVSRLNMGALEELARAKGATDEEIAGCMRTSVESTGVRLGGAKKGRAT
jgi:PD-(D/E)XK nuclease superfamily